MKNMVKGLMVIACLACPLKAQAQLVVADAVVETLLTKMGIDQLIYYAQQIEQTVMSVAHLYTQVQYMIEAERRALRNLQSIVDVRNFDDFMKWQNRQLYMEQEVEGRFNNLGVRIGNKTYKAEEIDKIPDALRTRFGDEYWAAEFTDEQRKQMYVQLGLSPGNYNYVKKWQQKEEEFVKKAQVQSSILRDEQKDAAARYNQLMQQYATSGEDLDLNEIAKNMGITLMQLELLMREMAIQTAEKNEYDVTMNKLANTPPNPPRLSDHWNDNSFGRITEGYHE
jgi:hypothetical protein